jgi:energy-converting hydrogenase Eha subunit C
VIVSLALVEGGMVEVAAGREYLQALLGPFAEAA